MRLRTLCLSVVCAASVSAAGPTVFPTRVEIRDAYSQQQLVVELDGRDATHRATYTSGDAKVATVGTDGFVQPTGDGATEITVGVDGRTVRIPVDVKGHTRGRSVDFSREIVPVFSRHGCNSGGCHGKQNGQNGFQLSLFGFDKDFDFAAVALEARGRRIFPAAPDRSLLLLKATAVLPHGGGRRVETDSEAYRLMHEWIANGAPRTAPDAPRVVRLHIHPRDRVFRVRGNQQLAATAEYSDGSKRDVTRLAQYSSNLEPVATVDDNGLVSTVKESGEATVMARYMGYVAVFTAIVPHGEPLKTIPGFEPINRIDELAAEKWKKLGLQPSPTVDDATYLRRVTVDLAGRLPTGDEVRAFLADKAPTKRAAAVDRLLQSPDYPAFFAMRWGTILRNSRLAGADEAAIAFHNWLKRQIAANRPYDELVRGVVAAAGEWQDAPAVNWYWQMRDDQLHQVATDTAQVFLGIRLACARCHHHPYERWGQEDYYGLAGFFTRLGRKSFGQPPPYFTAAASTTGEKNPLTGKTPEPKYPDGEYAKFTPEDDPRHALVDWMVRPENPFFARVMVNRLWGHFLGRGLVHQIDDMRETNPPSNPELLDYLSAEFVKTKFDVKHIIRLIVNSRVYQLSSEPTEHNKLDRQNFARFYARRLIAEVLHDGVDQACGTKATFGNTVAGARAVDLPHEGFGSYFLEVFDRPRRVTGCECERSSAPTLAQVLLLANSDEIEGKLASGTGRIALLIKDKKTVPESVESLYLAALGRLPSDSELRASVEYVKSEGANAKKALEDLLWTLLNSKEFLFQH